MSAAADPIHPAVSIRDVAKTWTPEGRPPVHALRNLSLDIMPGEFVVLLGPSGCGKTTILRMIAGFLEPTEGRVLIGGKDMRGLGPNQRPTAMIFQSLALFPLIPMLLSGLYLFALPYLAPRRRLGGSTSASQV